MRQVIAGDGSDSTAAATAYLLAGNTFRIADLILIGEPEDPLAHWLTNWDTPLTWPPYGTFRPAVFNRGSVNTKIGLEVDKLQFTWSPKVFTPTNNIATTSDYQRAQIGYFDGVKFRLWQAIMPTPGDCYTYGAFEFFGGTIQDCDIERGKITMSINSFLDRVNQNVPTGVIELTSPLGKYKGATPPTHNGTQLTTIPQFSIIAGSTASDLILKEQTPNLDQIFTDNELRGGFAYFNNGSSLANLWSPIYANKTITIGGHNYNQVVLYQPLPWTPTPGVDTCFLAGKFPINDGDGPYIGFPFVPSPGSAIAWILALLSGIGVAARIIGA